MSVRTTADGYEYEDGITLYVVLSPDYSFDPYEIVEVRDTVLRNIPLYARRWTDPPNLPWVYYDGDHSYGPPGIHFAKRENAAHEIVKRLTADRDKLNEQIDFWRNQCGTVR